MDERVEFLKSGVKSGVEGIEYENYMIFENII